MIDLDEVILDREIIEPAMLVLCYDDREVYVP